ncbi:hypothetical protein [Roseospira goensis]|uniref:Uncharacterized protein n=1 Tax=Roseospira goensis TaxID=391922 RepID=A0A7W6S2F0_9PROT|nr:hypothetical protein [Roseospira goensis]MBB4287512.1 hypothetical protein [Roseospira goensis]
MKTPADFAAMSDPDRNRLFRRPWLDPERPARRPEPIPEDRYAHLARLLVRDMRAEAA